MTFISYAQNFEDVLLWRALKDVGAGFYIDLGAWDPDLHSVTRAFSQRGWRGINIEPMAEQLARLRQHRPLDVNLGVAVGAAPRTATFYEVTGTGLSTLDADLAGRHAAAGLTVNSRQVEIATLADICRRHAPPVIHFLKLDIEGAERDALAGADLVHFRPWIIVVEATVPNSPEENHGEWEELLLQAAYRHAWFDGLNRFYVALEHYDRLAPRLALPPNVFDGFVRVADIAPSPPPSALPLATTPLSLTPEDRIALARQCRDCDDVPKVPGAGQVQSEPDGTRVQIMHNGLKVLADGYYGAWMTRLITLCQGHHEPQEERLFHQLVTILPADAAMLELGGFWAYYTAWFLHGAPGRRAVVLEPDPSHRAVGERNLALNGLRADFMSGFAGAEPAPPSLFSTEVSGTLLLPRFSVPEIMAMQGLQALTILHCDTQGAELSVLTGCRELFLAGKIRWAFVSTHVHHISGDPLTHRHCLDLLRGCGAVIEAEHNPYESFSGDGLIVARFGAAPAGWRPVRISVARQGEALFREPVFDLADALASFRADGDLARHMVTAAFETLLFRSIDAGDLTHFADMLRRTGDVAAFLRAVLQSPEFATKRHLFTSAFLGGTAADKPLPRIPADSPVATSGLHLVLRQDGALGRKGDTLLVPNDKVILPVVLATGGWNAHHLAFLSDHLDMARRYTLLDIGANVGLFSRQVLHRFANIAQCHCLEPDPANYVALRFNMASMLDGAVQTHPVGLGDADGDAAFHRDLENCGNYSLHDDAMRDRPFTTTSVAVRAARPWLDRHLPGEAPILWKSDTQGNDETIVAACPWPIWRRVDVAVVELWRIRRGPTPPGFLEKVADMPNRRIAGAPVSVDDVAAYIAGDDWTHEDLFLWR